MDEELENSYLERKQRIEKSICNNELKVQANKGFLFALKHKIFPLFDLNNTETNENEIDKYNDLYFAKKDLVFKVLRTVDLKYGVKECFSFYHWEDIFGKENRDELIYIFRYAYLSEKFKSHNFWNTLIDHKNNPDEANWIIDDEA